MNQLLESIENDIECSEWNERIVKHTFVPWTSLYGSRSADILNRSEVSLRMFDRCAVPDLCDAFRKGNVDGRTPVAIARRGAHRIVFQVTTGKAGAANLDRTFGLRSISTTNETAFLLTSVLMKARWEGGVHVEFF
jgi:hypothetical protein